MRKLTALSAKAISKPGKHGDGGGLYLHITSSGAKAWVQRIVIRGRRQDLGLGPSPDASLAQARDMAHDNRAAVAQGRDPVAEKREAREASRRPTTAVPTFAEAAARVIELRCPTWSNPKHAAQWRSTLQTYAFPFIGATAVDAVTPTDAMEVLSPIWTAKLQTASRVRQRMETVLDWAVAQGYRLDNPADGPQALPLLDGIETGGAIADKEFGSNRILAFIRSGGAAAVIPPKGDRIEPWDYDRELYRQLNLIERASNKLKHWRRIATRYDRKSLYFLSALYLVSSVISS